MSNLEELAIKYSTDKYEHGYIPFYEAHLPKNPTRILEIGCLKGASLRMWREYFPDAEIHCLDLFQEYKPPKDIPGVTYWKGSQVNMKLLEQVKKHHFDVIIDDGSHMALHQLVTLYTLMPNCDQYFIEDLHCNREEFYREGLPFKATVLGQIEYGIIPFWPVIDESHKIAMLCS